jgi:hypothetical protein
MGSNRAISSFCPALRALASRADSILTHECWVTTNDANAVDRTCLSDATFTIT